MEEKIKFSKDMIDFIDESPCSYLAVKSMEKLLKENGFKKYNFEDEIKLKKGDKGFITNNDSALIAFSIFDEDIEEKGFKMIGSHTDSPGFRIKSNPVMKTENILKLNTEVYGGPILSTWLDRILSLAGRVSLKGEDPFHPEIRFINIDRDLLTIPNLAIHMNRDVNEGFDFNPQIDTLPIFALEDEEKFDREIIDKIIAEELGVEIDSIIDFDLYLYDREKGNIIGLDDEFISIGRIDNLSMAYTSLRALVDTKNGSGVNVMVCTDNEEVGSKSIQGADSPMVTETLERISIALGKNREEFLRSVENSFLISADMAHAVHPNFKEKSDPTNRPHMGRGPVIKYSANKAYTSDAYSASVFKALCKKANVEYQEFYNRSDEKGGSTIGPITSGHLNIKSVDVGNAMLGMHSIKELASVNDTLDIYKVFCELYK